MAVEVPIFYQASICVAVGTKCLEIFHVFYIIAKTSSIAKSGIEIIFVFRNTCSACFMCLIPSPSFLFAGV